MNRYYMALMTKDCRVVTQTAMFGTRQECKDRANAMSKMYNFGNKVLPARKISGGLDQYELDLPEPDTDENADLCGGCSGSGLGGWNGGGCKYCNGSGIRKSI